MAATKNEISNWFDEGVAKGATHMIIVCDTWDHEDYPSYVMPNENVYEKETYYHNREMQNVMEVYNLNKDKETQMSKHRCFEY